MEERQRPTYTGIMIGGVVGAAAFLVALLVGLIYQLTSVETEKERILSNSIALLEAATNQKGTIADLSHLSARVIEEGKPRSMAVGINRLRSDQVRMNEAYRELQSWISPASPLTAKGTFAKEIQKSSLEFGLLAASSKSAERVVNPILVRRTHSQLLNILADYSRSLEACRALAHESIEAAMARKVKKTQELYLKVLGAIVLLVAVVAFPLSIQLRAALRQAIRDRWELSSAYEELLKVKSELQQQTVEAMEALEEAKAQSEMFKHASNRFQQLFGGLPVGCLTYDEHGVVRECNPAMSELLGVQDHIICDSPISFTFRSEEDLNPILGVVSDVIQYGARCEFEWTHHHEKRGTVHAAYLSYPLKNVHGAILGGILAGFDLTARKEAERKLRESEERFNTAVEASSTGLFDWHILDQTQHWSPRVYEILGLDASYVPGPNAISERLHPDDREKMLFDLGEHLEGRTTAYSHEFRVRREDGEFVWVHVRGEAIRNEEGQAVRMAGAVDDIDARKRTELALAESEARFRGVTEAAGEFVFEVSRKGVFTLVTDRIEEILGYSASEIVGSHVDENWPGAFREFFRQGLGQALRRREKVSNAVIWGAAKSGEMRCFRLSASPILDREGRFQGYRGTGLDITEQRMAEDALAEAHKMLHDTLESIRDCFYSLDASLRFTFANHAACSQLGVNSGELLGRGILEVCTPGLSRLLEPKLRYTLENRREQTFELLDPDTGAWCHYRVYPREHGVSVFYQDITERKSIEAQIEAQMLEINEKNMILQLQQKNLEDANRRLATLATTDGLTGLKNHKAFQASLAEGCELAKAEGTPISLIMLDVDHFKLYNDAFGHPAGDEVLRSVALVLKSLARKEDVVARYGGEEFAVLLPRTSAIDAMMVAERIRKGIADHPWTNAAVTASLGVASWDGGASTRAEFLDQADAALYVSKHSGRNCVSLATEDSQPRRAA